MLSPGKRSFRRRATVDLPHGMEQYEMPSEEHRHYPGNPHEPGSPEAHAWDRGARHGYKLARSHSHHDDDDDAHHTPPGSHHHHDDDDPAPEHRGPHGVHVDRRTTDKPTAGLDATLAGLNAFMKGHYRKPRIR
jgi:hypothetical protein